MDSANSGPSPGRSTGTRMSPSSTRNSRPAPRGTASYKRRRAVKACQVCRARRTKCDNLKPSCSFCLKVGATCVQSPTDLSSFDPASLKILERLDDLEELFKESSGKNSAEEPDPRARPEIISAPLNMNMVLPGTVDDTLLWPCFRDLLTPAQKYSGISPGRSMPSVESPVSVLGGLDLEPIRVKDLLNNFFRYVHVKNPIFDERATRQVVQSTILNGVDWSPESCLSLLICALGSIATPFGPSHDTMPRTSAYSSALSFFQAAQKRIGGLLFSNDIIAPQCLFLSGVFAMCTFQPTKAWRYFVQALAQCQQFDFLAKGSKAHYPQAQEDPCIQGSDDDSLHHAVYWSAWKSEREMRACLHLPDFSPSDHGANIYPAFFPTPPVPREGAAPQMDVDQQLEQTSWYFYLAEISLRRLAARIGGEIEVLRKTHSTRQAFLEAAALAVPAYEAQMQGWVDSLPTCLSFEAPAEKDDVCRFVLRGHSLNFFEQLYWPFLSVYLDTSVLDATVLAPFANLAQKSLDYHALRLMVNKPGYRHRHHGTVPMMHSCSRSALVLLAAGIYNRSMLSPGTRDGNCAFTLPLDLVQSVSGVIGLLDCWSAETRDFDRVRHVLEQGLFNVMN